MNSRDKRELGKIIYEFLDLQTGINGHDSAVVANAACDMAVKIRQKFDIQEVLLAELAIDPSLTDKDRSDFLKYLE